MPFAFYRKMPFDKINKQAQTQELDAVFTW